MKHLLGKVQKENAQYKMVVKGLRQDHERALNSSGIMNKTQANSMSDYAVMLTKKI